MAIIILSGEFSTLAQKFFLSNHEKMCIIVEYLIYANFLTKG